MVVLYYFGVYLVYDFFYDVWLVVWNVCVILIEEYFYLKFVWFRRGFIYKGVKVIEDFKICYIKKDKIL